MISELKITANRANAQRSTGPRTAEGKARSSQNALKHGAYSRKLLLPDESEEDLLRIERAYIAHFRPPTELERHEVCRLALLTWRLERFARIEAEILRDHGYQPDREAGVDSFYFAGPGWALAHDCCKAGAIEAASRCEERLSRQVERLRQRLDERLRARQRLQGRAEAVVLATN